jgi:hypothetical protein
VDCNFGMSSWWTGAITGITVTIAAKYIMEVVEKWME